jgi:hypothetical protein
MTTPTRAMSPVTFQGIGSQPVQIINAGSGPAVAVYNGDTTNVLLVSPSSGGISVGNSVPVQPLTTAVIDGTYRQFAAAQTGTCATVTVAPGATQINPSPAQVAAQINALGLATATNQQSQLNTGAPLTHGMTNLVSQGTVVAGGATVVVGPFTVTRPGYISFFAAQFSGVPTVPLIGITVLWVDTVTGWSTAQEDWYIPGNQAFPGIKVYGKGPTKANSVQITIKNFDPAVTCTITTVFFDTTQHISRDDWRSDSPVNVVGFTVPPLTDPFAGILGAAVATVFAANQTLTYILPLYSGEVWFQNNASNGNLTITVTALDPTTSNDVVYGPVTLTATQLVPLLIPLPRCACSIKFTASAILTNTWHIGILELAS